MRRLWPGPSYLLRPEDPPGSRLALWRDADLSGHGDSPSRLSKVPESEAGETGLVGRLSFQHQAVCLLRRPPLPGFEYSGCSRRVALGLEDGQGLGNAVHARAIAPSGDAWAEGDRHRRGFAAQGAYLSDCRQRPGEEAADLVWGTGPLGSEFGSFLCVVGAEEEQENPLGGHGHVESLWELDPEKCAASGHPF